MTEPLLPAPLLPPAAPRRRWWGLVAGGTLVLLVGLGVAYRWLLAANVRAEVEGPAYLYIRPGEAAAQVYADLSDRLARPRDFELLAGLRHYGTPASPVRPGRYTLPAGLGNLALLRLLADGRQDTLTFTLKPFHYLPQLPRQAGRQLYLDTTQLHKLLTDNAYLVGRYGLDTA